jgi:hypothetical protein
VLGFGLLLGVEAGQERSDAELELVVGGAPGQQRSQLDVVGELAGGRAAKKAHMRRTNSSLVCGVVPAPGDLQGDEPHDVGQQGIDGADHGLVGEPRRPQDTIDGIAEAQAVGAWPGCWRALPVHR